MTAIITTMPISEPARALLRRQLRQRLLSLPYRAFLQVVLQLLHSQGATTVHPAGRAHWKGRNHSGGWDAEAEFAAGPLGSVRCLVQAKQYATLTVHQRSVDELRGSCLRAGAPRAILLTLSRFSPTVQQGANMTAPLVPIRLIDGEELLEALITQGVGVTSDLDGNLRIDAVYFHQLTEQFGVRTASPQTPMSEARSETRGYQQVRLARLAPNMTVVIKLTPRPTTRGKRTRS